MRLLIIQSILWVISLTMTSVCHGQLLDAPNKTINGRKQGLWNELEFLDSMNIDGKKKLLFGQHYTPLQMVTEGYHLDGNKTGIWKSYWIEGYIDSNTSKYRKGALLSIVDYDNGFMSGLYISYFKNGGIRLLGHYQKYEDPSIDTIHFTDPYTGVEKDTVIVSKYSSKMTGLWYEFESNGKILKTIDYGQHAALRQRRFRKGEPGSSSFFGFGFRSTQRNPASESL